MALRRHSQRILTLAVAGAVLAAAVALYLDRRTRAEVATSRQTLAGTYQLERAFESLQIIVTELENSQRGFLLTGEPRDLARYEQEHQPFAVALNQLARVAETDPLQRARATEVAVLASQKVQTLERIAALARYGKKDEALQLVAESDRVAHTERIRELTKEARAQELSQLVSRQRAYDDAVARRRRLSQSLVFASLAISITALWLMIRVQRLESFVTMCAWSRTIEMDGEWLTFEEYLHRRFHVKVSHGIAPDEMTKLMAQVETLDAARLEADSQGALPNSPDHRKKEVA